MEDLKLKIEKHYENYDEDNRLIKDKSHSIEFITSTTYLNKYLSNNQKVLEVGAATGRYSFYYSQKGCKVTALEISQKHIEIMKNKLKTTDLELEIVQGNALDLKQYEDESFDTVLCLGPIYHLKPKEKTTVAVEVKKDLKLKLEEYTYNISEKNNDKYYKNYTIFINEAKYNIEEYQNIEERNGRNLIF
ncbi:class I SAM-dependent methyltransferase [Romboutsia sp.]|uniref:class I SAM-dependent methyltransferase n=1 Tax=Romboutsia sp. TaxID=1965302 RepID=UPI003F2BC70D